VPEAKQWVLAPEAKPRRLAVGHALRREPRSLLGGFRVGFFRQKNPAALAAGPF